MTENNSETNAESSSDANRGLHNIEQSLIDAKGSLKNKLRDKKIFIGIVSLCILPLVLHFCDVLKIPFWLQIILWILAAIFLLAFWGTETGQLESQVESLDGLIKYYRGVSSTEEKTYFDSLVQINVSNLDAYYSLVKTHTKRSFTFSATTGFIGFSLLVAGLVAFYQQPDQQHLGYMTSGSGLIVEFISGVFFYLYNKTVRQLKDYHDSLLDVQNILLSFKLIESTKDEEKRTAMIDKMIEFLVGMIKTNSPSTVYGEDKNN